MCKLRISVPILSSWVWLCHYAWRLRQIKWWTSWDRFSLALLCYESIVTAWCKNAAPNLTDVVTQLLVKASHAGKVIGNLAHSTYPERLAETYSQSMLHGTLIKWSSAERTKFGSESELKWNEDYPYDPWELFWMKIRETASLPLDCIKWQDKRNREFLKAGRSL